MDSHYSMSGQHHLNLAIKKTYIQDTKIKNHDAKIKDQEAKIEYQGKRLSKQQQEIEAQRAKMEIQEKEINSLKKNISTIMDRLKDPVESPQNPIFSDTHEWKIYQYWSKLERARNGYNEEKPITRRFYTHKGHKLKADIYLNGQSTGFNNSTSFFIQTEKGNYDDTIKWPMRAKIVCNVQKKNGAIIEEIDTKEDKSCFRKNNTDDFAYGIYKLIDHSSIDDCVMNSILTIKLTIRYY